uniref:hypothetical protein n=1 Tax=Parerythrobacter lutipelagi TaxID=1964208 RepID=UPI0010F48C5D|nr:hypothetical protein [Parerythrobacter lutipelagi]
MKNIQFSAVIVAVSMLTALWPAQTAAREAVEVSCPQTLTSPEAQSLLEAGGKPEIVKSWYKPGLVNLQGFCTITVGPDGKTLFQTYNEATTVQQIPVRVAFHSIGFDVYAGPKGLPFGSGPPDMTCWAPEEGQSAVDCRIAVAENSGLSVRLKEGRGVEAESILAIDPKEMFGRAVKEQSRYVHFTMNMRMLSPGSLMDMFSPAGNTYDPVPVDCAKDIWKNTATNVAVSTGPRKGDSMEPTFSVQIVGEDVSLLSHEAGEIPPVVPRFTSNLAGGSAQVIGQIMSSEVVRVDVTTACEGTLTKGYLTEVGRLMGQIYTALKPRMVQQL